MKIEKYAVFRDEHRVSDVTYNKEIDAREEKEHWDDIVKRSKDGSVVKVKKILVNI
jgi:hypothetical protein